MAELRPSVYVETTVPGYLMARSSNDPIVLGRQRSTQLFWDGATARFDLVVSEAVLEETSAGDPQAAAERIHAVRDLPVLARNDEVNELTRFYRQLLQLPDRAAVDAAHLAFAVVYAIDYVATWNLKHLANGDIQRKVTLANHVRGLHVPSIVTPDVLLPSD